MQKSNITISKLTADVEARAFALICDVFVNSSVLHQALGITSLEYRDYAVSWFTDTVKQNYSLVAVDDASGKVVGCLLACDYMNQTANPAEVPEKFRPLSALLGRLDEKYREYRSVVVGECLLVDIAVVHPDVGGQGVYRRLREALHRVAYLGGYHLVVGELSSAATQHVCVRKMGQHVCAETKYADFEFEGRLPFSAIAEPKGIVIVEASVQG